MATVFLTLTDWKNYFIFMSIVYACVSAYNSVKEWLVVQGIWDTLHNLFGTGEILPNLLVFTIIYLIFVPSIYFVTWTLYKIGVREA